MLTTITVLADKETFSKQTFSVIEWTYHLRR